MATLEDLEKELNELKQKVGTIETSRAQLAYPLDQQSDSSLLFSLDKITTANPMRLSIDKFLHIFDMPLIIDAAAGYATWAYSGTVYGSYSSGYLGIKNDSRAYRPISTSQLLSWEKEQRFGSSFLFTNTLSGNGTLTITGSGTTRTATDTSSIFISSDANAAYLTISGTPYSISAYTSGTVVSITTPSSFSNSSFSSTSWSIDDRESKGSDFKIVRGDSTSGSYYGFQLTNKILYGISTDGSTTGTVLLGTIPFSTNYSIYAKLTPKKKIEFFYKAASATDFNEPKTLASPLPIGTNSPILADFKSGNISGAGEPKQQISYIEYSEAR